MKTLKKKICSRGHVYTGPGPCPKCWPAGAKKHAAKKTAYTHRHADGSLWAKGFMSAGKMTGFWKWFRKDGTVMRTGHEGLTKLGIRKIDFERTREKGIDVKLAVDLIVGAIDDKYDTAIVVSSDSDLIPAMDWVRVRMKKQIEYIGFSMPHRTDPAKSVRPLASLIHRSDIQRTLAEPDLKGFVRPFTGKKPD